MRQVKKERRGDTLIEVMLSISIFAFIAMLTINMMNDGINTAQRTLEAEMARNEIDAQAEALRFIHNSYVSERTLSEAQSQFRKIWKRIVGDAVRPSWTDEDKQDDMNGGGKAFNINNMNSCSDAYATNNHLDKYKAFILNTRLLVPDMSNGNNNFKYLGYKYASDGDELSLIDHMVIYRTGTHAKSSVFQSPAIYPRLIYGQLTNKGDKTYTDEASLDESNKLYNNLVRAEGIWINAVGNVDADSRLTGSDYYDFYIRTCWHGAGSRVPSTITTVVRLYNPEVME